MTLASKQTDKQNNVGSPPGAPDDDKELPWNPSLTGFKDPCRSTEPRRPNPVPNALHLVLPKELRAALSNMIATNQMWLSSP